MNRVIKFRVWNTIDKSFHRNLYDYFILNLNGDIGIVKENDVIIFKPDCFIVQQFTSLTDSAGKDIYEGDIILFDEDNYLVKNGLYCVGDDNFNGDYLLVEKGSVMDYGISLANIHNSDLQIVGNIFENPELLKN